MPMLVKWPGVTEPGSVNEGYVIIEDVYPTFLELAGFDKGVKNSIDGKSSVSMLNGSEKTNSNRALL